MVRLDLTASKLMAPSRIASSAGAATSVSGTTSGFQEPPQVLERFRRCPTLQGSRLVQGAKLLLEERQIVLRVKNELATTIDARMPGNLARSADDRNPSTKPLTRTSRKP
jgi:hypothetical protein